MGKNNKARRAAKAKQRSRRPPSAGGAAADPFGFPGSGPFGVPLPPSGRRAEARRQIVEVLIAAERSALLARGKDDYREGAEHRAGRLAAQPDDLVDEAVAEMLLSHVDSLWSGGWQPAEVRREAQRSSPAPAARLIERAVLVDASQRLGRVDPRWAAQLAEFPLRTASTQGPWLATWASAEGLDRREALMQVLLGLRVLLSLPVLELLIPPPGAPPAEAAGVPVDAGRAEDAVLRRVRKLLAKAESTVYEQEAEALTAKAHELMVRHAIDSVSLTEPVSKGPVMTRLPIDAPYADAKALLLTVVAEAYRCRAVQLKSLDMSTVVGHAGDLAVTELLFVSLLVQAQNALNVASKLPRPGRSRTQAFRSSFYVSYAHRIGDRLRSVTAEVVEAAGDAGRAASPVLRSREDAVADAFEARFGGSLVSSTVRGGHDPWGAAAGREAAEAAALDSGVLLR